MNTSAQPLRAPCSFGSESKGITQKLERYGDIHTKQRGGYRIGDWALSQYPKDEPGTDVHAITKEKRIEVSA
ncbi:MAG: hypothetical protein ACE5OW_01295 [Candidatus Bathyarchaeia archaeon]